MSIGLSFFDQVRATLVINSLNTQFPNFALGQVHSFHEQIPLLKKLINYF